MPATIRAWPEGAFFGIDRVHDGPSLGYRGPGFSFSPMPDQYTLAAFERLEHGRAGPRAGDGAGRADLQPRAVDADPEAVDWDAVGDGTVFAPQVEGAEPTDEVWKDDDRVRAAYRDSTAYSLGTLISYVERYGNDNLVLIFLGDHQPQTSITGDEREPRRADHDRREGPGGAGPDRRLALGRGPAAGPAGAGVADGVVPRPVPDGVRAGARAGALTDRADPVRQRQRSLQQRWRSAITTQQLSRKRCDRLQHRAVDNPALISALTTVHSPQMAAQPATRYLKGSATELLPMVFKVRQNDRRHGGCVAVGALQDGHIAVRDDKVKDGPARVHRRRVELVRRRRQGGQFDTSVLQSAARQETGMIFLDSSGVSARRTRSDQISLYFPISASGAE